MNTMLEPVNRFVNTMIESQAAFEQVKLEIDQKNQAVDDCIKRFQKNIAEAMSASTADDMDEELKNLYEKARNSLGDLLTAVADEIERTRKGSEFIKRYEQSFNVAVFGKVKAGKSYLGNFIMGNQLRDMGLETAYDKLPRPTVEVYDRGSVRTESSLAEIDGGDGFYVDANEATSAIQLFRLGALTWFDTPGIGSVTWENEMLAKDYVDNADLVVYTSNSDAAGTRQDFAEMKELYCKGKQFLLLLTQSDTLEEDCDEETGDTISILVAKSDKDRQDTEQYMVETLTEHGIPRLKKGELLTISAKLALTALEEDDEARFRDSHMGDFLNILTDITRTDGARLKRETPAKRIDAAIAGYLEKLNQTEKKLLAYQKDLKEKQNALSERSDTLRDNMRQQCRNQVDTLIQKKAAEVEKTRQKVTDDQLSELISMEVQDVLQRNCVGEFAASAELLADYLKKLKVEGPGDLEMKTDVIKYQITVVERVQREPEGLFENVGAFFGKEYYKNLTTQEDRESTVDLFVNTQQIISITQGQLDKLFSEEIPKLMKLIDGHYMKEVTDLLEKSVTCIRSARKELESLKCKP